MSLFTQYSNKPASFPKLFKILQKGALVTIALCWLTLYIRNIISNFTSLSYIFDYNFWTEAQIVVKQKAIEKYFPPLFQFVDFVFSPPSLQDP